MANKARDLPGHTTLTQTSSYCVRDRERVAAAIQRKEAYEGEQARAAEAERENRRDETEGDNQPVPTSEVLAVEVVKL